MNYLIEVQCNETKQWQPILALRSLENAMIIIMILKNDGAASVNTYRILNPETRAYYYYKGDIAYKAWRVECLPENS